MAGFQLTKPQGASSYSGGVTTYTALVANTDVMAIGDAVILSGTADTDGNAAIERASASAGTEITGIISGFERNMSDLEQKGRAAAQLRKVFVSIDPNNVYTVVIGSALTVVSVGGNVLLVATAPTTTGNLVRSAMTIGAVSGTGHFRLVSLVPPTDGGVLGAVGQLATVAIVRSTLTDVTGE